MQRFLGYSRVSAGASKGTAVLSLEELVRSAVAARIHSTNGTLIPVLTMYSEAAAKEGDETAAGRSPLASTRLCSRGTKTHVHPDAAKPFEAISTVRQCGLVGC